MRKKDEINPRNDALQGFEHLRIEFLIPATVEKDAYAFDLDQVAHWGLVRVYTIQRLECNRS
jgi:hypothetical protein